MKLSTEIEQDVETNCPDSDDGQHCHCWYDGFACCYCQDPAEPALDDE